MCDQHQAIRILRDAAVAAVQIFGVPLQEGFLYGSYARGDYTDESDVDILLIIDLPPAQIARHRRELAEFTSQLSLAYDVTVSVAVKSAAQFARYADVLPYYQNVLREGIRYAG